MFAVRNICKQQLAQLLLLLLQLSNVVRQWLADIIARCDVLREAHIKHTAGRGDDL